MSKSDGRPPVAVGHVLLASSDLAASTDFLVQAGLRMIESGDGVAVLELRGGTHLIVVPGEKRPAPGTAAAFDLMVDDIEATHDRYEALGLAPSKLIVAEFHTSFTITEPGGHEIKVNSSHASDQPV